ncbi:MAG: diaminopimelate decarboxylase [Anaerolineales bacterium]|nr:diaminopimelate decarboxylase [Anaerolineales bacterium]
MDEKAFRYVNDELMGEDVPLARVAAAVGTPVYVYSRAVLTGRAAAFVDAARLVAGRGGQGYLVCFAVKANGNPALLRLLGEQGMGADVTSGGELFLARHAGISPTHILFSGVGKSHADIEQALDAGIRALHIESVPELARIAGIAAARQIVAPIAVRLNPDVTGDTHPAISTGGRWHKFGVSADTARRLLWQAQADPWLAPVGLAVHIGSQIRELEPFRQAVAVLLREAEGLAAAGCRLRYLDVGGGLGVDEGARMAPRPADWVAAVGAPVVAAGYELVLEPGRSVVGDAGILLTRVEYVKEEGGRRFVVVDAGMNDFIRPTLYAARHPIWPIRRRAGESHPVDIVGPVCETGDAFAHDYALPPVAAGDLLAVQQAGAYGFAMSSNYNGRLRAAEVLVDAGTFHLIRPRQTVTDLLG